MDIPRPGEAGGSCQPQLGLPPHEDAAPAGGAAQHPLPRSASHLRYNTAKGYEGIIEHHIIPAIGTIKLKQLSSIHIQRMYNDLKERGRMQRGSKQNDKALSNTFVRRVHAVLQAALKQAVKERLIPYNPVRTAASRPRTRRR